ncbi:MAG: hypothetical protein J6S19_04070, partial [Lentisphaeria bacterium]|nr:hypothetical protein [Lentisphaeria bacterium]
TQFGGGIRICPDAKVNDGKLNVIIVDNIKKKISIIKAFLKLMKGKITEYPSTTHFLCDSVRFVPAKAVLSGPARVLDSIQEIYTEPIPIDEQLIDSFEYRCTLRVPAGTRIDRKEVDAQVEVVKALTTHTFRSVPLLIIQSAERTRKFQVTHLEPETVTVVVNGPRGTLARMHSREISASISLDKIDKPGTYNLPVAINVNNPARTVAVKNFQPQTAKVTVVQE